MAQPHHQARVTSRGCDGFRAMPRRAALQVGSFGALGLSLGDLFRIRAARGEASTDAYSTVAGQGKLPEKIKAVIQLNLGGGFPQHESFDPKPEAPVEYRGSFGVVKTKNGDIFSDNLPKTAAIADKFTVIRSMVGKIPDHVLASYHLSTGYTPTAVIDYPAMGSIISHELGPRGLLPPYIAVPARLSYGGGTGFLSSSHGAYELGADPGQSSDPAQRKNFKVRDFSLPEGFPIDRFDRRRGAAGDARL